MCIQPTTLAAVEQQQFGKLSAAKLLGPQERQALAVDALAGTQSISQLAVDHDVSRKFVYQQAEKAEQALQEAFARAHPLTTKFFSPSQ